MKLLVIGGGAIADSVHIPSALKLLGRDNVYLAEPLPERAAQMAAKHSLVNVYDDYHRCIKYVDACVIATPPHLHNSILEVCIKEGKHVLCEKPLSPSSVETREILGGAKPGLVLGGVLFDMGIHPLDFVYWCLGKPRKLEYEDNAAGGLEDNAFVSMHYPNSRAQIRISRSKQLSNFLNAIEGKEPIACPIEEGLDVIEIVERCYSLHRTSMV